MPTQYATMRNFDPVKGWGFARIDGTIFDVYINMGRKRRVNEEGWVSDCSEGTGLPDIPTVGDKLVVDLYPKNNIRSGTFTIRWAFRLEWDGVYNLESGGQAKERLRMIRKGIIPKPSSAQELTELVERPSAEHTPTVVQSALPVSETPVSQPKKVTPVEVRVPAPTEAPFTVDELFKVFDYHFLHAIVDAMENGEITEDLLRDFARNTPKGKTGADLWKMYQKWTPQNVKQKKTPAGFICSVLEAAGRVV